MEQIKVKCPEDVIAGALITRDKRQQLFGQVAGGAGSMTLENYQRKKIIEGTGIDCTKTHVRINLRDFTLQEISKPNILNNGFDFTEDFDGIQSVKEFKVYLNLKCVVGKGGAQTRSLREVYWFIEGQLHLLTKMTNVYFANVLDGDEAHHCKCKFNYLLSLPEFKNVANKIYVGDLEGYFDWFQNIFDKPPVRSPILLQEEM